MKVIIKVVNHMPRSKTTACYALTTLNDDGYLACCESDFVAIPSGVLLASNSERWVGLKGKIVEVPFRPICRTQFDIWYDVSDTLLAERMLGFHWMTCYNDYREDIGYAFVA